MSDLINDLMNEYADLEDQIAPAIARMEEIKKQFRGLDPKTYELDAGRVIVSLNGRLDPDKVAEEYPAEKHPMLYQTQTTVSIEAAQELLPRDKYPEIYRDQQVVDTKALEHHLSPAQLESLKTYGSPRVTIKRD